jgi:hypothetical protein
MPRSPRQERKLIKKTVVLHADQGAGDQNSTQVSIGEALNGALESTREIVVNLNAVLHSHRSHTSVHPKTDLRHGGA